MFRNFLNVDLYILIFRIFDKIPFPLSCPSCCCFKFISFICAPVVFFNYFFQTFQYISLIPSSLRVKGFSNLWVLNCVHLVLHICYNSNHTFSFSHNNMRLFLIFCMMMHHLDLLIYHHFDSELLSGFLPFTIDRQF